MSQTDTVADTVSERCTPTLRWAPSSYLGAPSQTLQQLWEVTYYRGGRPWKRSEEWRDVPHAS